MFRHALRSLMRPAAGVALIGSSLSAQTPPSESVPAPDPADVISTGAIVLAVYDVISGPAGGERDWDRWLSLFAPDARLIPSGPRQEGGFGFTVITAEDYVTRAGPSLEQNGFFEVEIHRVTEQYGNIAHVFSTYESRRKAEDPEPFIRGINSFQLWNDGDRWWVLNVFWSDERSTTIPPKYLP